MGRRSQGALNSRAVSAGSSQTGPERRAIRASLRRGYREMGHLNLALAEEGLVFEHLDLVAYGKLVRKVHDP